MSLYFVDMFSRGCYEQKIQHADVLGSLQARTFPLAAERKKTTLSQSR